MNQTQLNLRLATLKPALAWSSDRVFVAPHYLGSGLPNGELVVDRLQQNRWQQERRSPRPIP